ncbi:MAG: Flp pilus assembly complex ATPase component TadA [Gammaproteobacteria bacterium]|nr:Flp pilus assembly complex ATPase component TadA [Gammaproteobacteria bacterium]
MMAARKKIRLGDLLVENKMISQQQLDAALADQKKSGRKLGKILVENGYLREDALLTFLSKQLNVPFVELAHFKFEPEVVKLIPEIHARRFRAVALKDKGDAILVGMSDPTNIFAYDELARLLHRPIELAVVREQELLETIEKIYRASDQLSGFAEQLSDELQAGDFDVDQLAAGADVTDAPVVRLLQTLFQTAVQSKASDIHIEPDEAVLRIRQRIDGMLHEQLLNEKRIAPALVQRLKLMSGLDIAEKRLPQDGRFSMRAHDKTIDVRISTMPLMHGESVVMRLLDQSEGVRDLEELGMPPGIYARFKAVISRPHGLVVVTGPTGSGKTSTLYSALKLLNRAQVKIVTVEDPVEYRLPRVNQVQVNSGIGLTFARVLRTTLRHDPDIVLVGEMRDSETVEIGLRAAMTGHLVLSTLHTNDAIGTISRLMDMGAPGYLLAASLHGVLGQRLIRRLCTSCAEPAGLPPDARAWIATKGGAAALAREYRHGRGCHACNNTGYKGRIGVYELLEIDRPLAETLASGDARAFSAQARAQPGYMPLAELALRYAQDGITSVEEVIRVAADVEAVVESELAAEVIDDAIEGSVGVTA